VPAPDLRFYANLPVDRHIAFICSSGNRSILAASLLEMRGFSQITNVTGGMTAWQAAGYPAIK
jgi:hydroxyacylglutathione hydrolase